MCYGFLCVGIYKELYYMMDDGKNPPRVVLAHCGKDEEILSIRFFSFIYSFIYSTDISAYLCHVLWPGVSSYLINQGHSDHPGE